MHQLFAAATAASISAGNAGGWQPTDSLKTRPQLAADYGELLVLCCAAQVEFRKFSKGEEVLCCFGTLCKYSCLSPEDCPNTPGFSAAGAALDALYSSYVTIELGLCFGGDAGKAIKPVLQLLGLELCFIKGSLQVYVFGKQLGYGVQVGKTQGRACALTDSAPTPCGLSLVHHDPSPACRMSQLRTPCLSTHHLFA